MNLELFTRRDEFNAIQAGEKDFTLRPWTPFWRRNLEKRHYDGITLICGARRLTFPWNAYRVDVGVPPSNSRACCCFKIYLWPES